ncbi:LmbE family N-acetylglucosaminyl deacetylase [Paracoccus lutimaris]|uniref:LmbE family N-acetylglucosaminyl deacetylase n=2 Tax=Paracoccus lutimaris TaxID=1490030 RepID=A0A368YJK1_9RHOB|nr:LmbE family N-acetylglucosaminyl deacetylase [Paracoccus lutimaris]
MTVFAHPDDAELSCFGLLSKLRRQGWRVILVIVTRGENGANCAAWRRVGEATAAARHIDAEIVFGDFQDGYVTRSAELVSWMEELLDEYRPQLVISHFAGETSTAHQDHVAVAAAVRIAARRARWYPTLLLAEGIDNDSTFQPNWFVDITDEHATKMAVIRLHASQREKYYMQEDYLETRARKWSLNFPNPPDDPHRKGYWEAFVLVQHAS